MEDKYKQRTGERIEKLACLVYEVSYEQCYGSNKCEKISEIANELCGSLQEIIEIEAGCRAFGSPKKSDNYVTYAEFARWYRDKKSKPGCEWFPSLPSWLEEKVTENSIAWFSLALFIS
jgi:hypothetical protein